MTTNAIPTAESLESMPGAQPNPATRSQAADERRWNAVLARDPARDGEFVFAVSSTGVYCRSSCPARRPRRENVRFFLTAEQAEEAGYRACLRCRPKSFRGNTESNGVKAICRFIEQHLDEAADPGSAGQGISPESFSSATPIQGGARHYAARVRRLLPLAHAEAKFAVRRFGYAGDV